jgi:hypothetical protein
MRRSLGVEAADQVLLDLAPGHAPVLLAELDPDPDRPVALSAGRGNPDHLAASIDLKEMSTEMETIAVGDVAYDQCSYIVVDRTENPTHKKSVSLMLYALRKIM